LTESFIDKFNVSRPKALLLLVLTAVLWSFAGLLIKLVNWNPLAIAGMRSAISALIMLALIRKPVFNFTFAQITGTIAYAGTVIMFVYANKLTTAANAILLQYTAPIYVAFLGAWFLKERVRPSDWATIVLVLGGMVLFFLDDLEVGGLTGNVLAIISGLSFAITILCLRSQRASSPLLTVFWGNVLTALIGFPFMFGSAPNAASWLGLLLLGVFQLGLSYIFFTIAIKKVSALEATLIPIIEPLLNPVFVLIIMGEIPGPWSIAGGIVILVSITLRCVYAILKPQQTAMPETKVTG